MKKAVGAVFCLVIFASATLAEENEPQGYEETTGSRPGGVKSMEKRITILEDAIQREIEGDEWYDRIQFSGLVEVEAIYNQVSFKDPVVEDEISSEIDLAKVELVVDARIVDHVDAHVMLKYQDDEVFIDEGFIILTGTEKYDAYLIAGRQYIPFGYFDSHFISDPTTLELGETNNGALVVGYRFGGKMVDFSAGAFNGRTNRIGEDDMIDSFTAAIVVSPTENLTLGVSYTSNLAASDGLSTQVTDVDGDGDSDNLSTLVGGYSGFITFTFLERLNLIGEFVGATAEFEAGELYSETDTKKRRPGAWNIEFGVEIIDSLELAGRYGGSEDGDAGGGEFLPEAEYGGVVNWILFESTNLALEYIHREYTEKFQKEDIISAQLAVEF